jgi:hypothetical protein
MPDHTTRPARYPDSARSIYQTLKPGSPVFEIASAIQALALALPFSGQGNPQNSRTSTKHARIDEQLGERGRRLILADDAICDFHGCLTCRRSARRAQSARPTLLRQPCDMQPQSLDISMLRSVSPGLFLLLLFRINFAASF